MNEDELSPGGLDVVRALLHEETPELTVRDFVRYLGQVASDEEQEALERALVRQPGQRRAFARAGTLLEEVKEGKAVDEVDPFSEEVVREWRRLSAENTVPESPGNFRTWMAALLDLRVAPPAFATTRSATSAAAEMVGADASALREFSCENGLLTATFDTEQIPRGTEIWIEMALGQMPLQLGGAVLEDEKLQFWLPRDVTETGATSFRLRVGDAPPAPIPVVRNEEIVAWWPLESPPHCVEGNLILSFGKPPARVYEEATVEVSFAPSTWQSLGTVRPEERELQVPLPVEIGSETFRLPVRVRVRE